MSLEDFGGGGCAVGPGVRVTDTDVEDSTSSAISKAVGQDITSGFISEDGSTGGYGRGVGGGRCGIGCTGLTYGQSRHKKKETKMDVE